ncbi:hypothetical protein [Halorubellus salinus]|uniref:hypothetical protein n=1 Tax=Halorubellus salinus TaxID=755309 RepID=UPI001D087817|nr:hypothetical protein [Halorubellus salinus]
MPLDSLAVVDAFDGGFGWRTAGDDSLARTSHALRTDDGLWLLDPLDAPGLDDVIAERGPGDDAAASVAGVAVCAGWHARDAAAVAARYDVPVTVPAGVDRALDHLEQPAGVDVDVQRADDRLPSTDVSLHGVSPMGAWTEAVCWRDRDRTLYVPESLGTADPFVVGDERLGVIFYARLLPPRDALAGFSPDRVLVGHGDGVFDDAAAALADALDASRRRFPRAVVENGPRAMRNLVAAALA